MWGRGFTGILRVFKGDRPLATVILYRGKPLHIDYFPDPLKPFETLLPREDLLSYPDPFTAVRSRGLLKEFVDGVEDFLVQEVKHGGEDNIRLERESLPEREVLGILSLREDEVDTLFSPLLRSINARYYIVSTPVSDVFVEDGSPIEFFTERLEVSVDVVSIAEEYDSPCPLRKGDRLPHDRGFTKRYGFPVILSFPTRKRYRVVFLETAGEDFTVYDVGETSPEGLFNILRRIKETTKLLLAKGEDMERIRGDHGRYLNVYRTAIRR